MVQLSSVQTYGLHRVALIIAATIVVATAGCQNILWRGQNGDGDAATLAKSGDPSGTKYVGDATAVWGLNFAKVEGIALVTQLNDTGSDPPPSWQREHLEKEMRRHNVKNVGEILKSKSTAMALVGGNLPPGIRKGERFDVYVTKGPRCETTSLRGGYLLQTSLTPKAVLNGRPRSGHDTAFAKGRIQARSLFEAGNDPNAETSGYILGGGVATENRDLGLALRDEFASLRNAMAIGRAINARFTTYDETGKINVADPKNDRNVVLLIPEEYRQNVGRFVRVINNVAYDETPQQRLDRLQQLERELAEPALAQQAALRLEAIGNDAIPALKRALQSQDQETRFFAAEALTYLDQADGIDELKSVAESLPDYRWHALTALASSEELTAGSVLTDLMHVANAECRYGAFRAMLSRSPQDPLMAADWMPGEFYLHVIPTTGPSLVHFSTQNRAEIVIFGGNGPVKPSFIYVENGLTVQANADDTIELIRYLPGQAETRVQCKNSVVELVRNMCQLGCSYETMLAMCKEAQKSETLNCKMGINRVPKLERLYARLEGDNPDAEAGIADSDGLEDMPGSVPSLFAPIPEAEGEQGLESLPPVQATSPKKGVFGTIRGWFTSRPDE